MARPHFFVLLGDSFLCEEKRKEILASLEKELDSSFPITLRRPGDLPFETVLSEARTLPFLARGQVFVFREADKFTKKDLELWAAYLKSPHPQSVFIFESGSLEKGHPLLEGKSRGGEVFFLEREPERIVSEFIRRKLKAAGKKMTTEAFEFLESRLGDSWIFLDTLLEQLILYSSARPEIDLSAVQALEERFIQFEGEELMEALAEKNTAEALRVLGNLQELSHRDTPSLIGLLHWQFRRFWEAKKALTGGDSENEVLTRLRIWPSRAQAFLKQLRRFSLPQLERILEGLFELDWNLKSGRAEGRYEIENWLVTALQ